MRMEGQQLHGRQSIMLYSFNIYGLFDEYITRPQNISAPNQFIDIKTYK